MDGESNDEMMPLKMHFSNIPNLIRYCIGVVFDGDVDDIASNFNVNIKVVGVVCSVNVYIHCHVVLPSCLSVCRILLSCLRFLF